LQQLENQIAAEINKNDASKRLFAEKDDPEGLLLELGEQLEVVQIHKERGVELAGVKEKLAGEL